MEQEGSAPGGPGAEAAPVKVRIFLVLGTTYLGVYGWILGHRLADYVRDVLRHFGFVRRWLGMDG